MIVHRELTRVGEKAHVVNRAFYDSRADQITVPPRGHFKTEGDYYRTVIHKIAHWTGHESRLNRGLDENKRGTPDYAWEELRAEMASAMICAALGVESRQRPAASLLTPVGAAGIAYLGRYRSPAHSCHQPVRMKAISEITPRSR